MKPFYKLDDFPDRKGMGKNWLATCPKCGKRHLYIDKMKGTFLCFYGGCDFKGMLEDFRDPRDSSNAGMQTVVASRRPHPSGKGNEGDGSLFEVVPQDYRQLDARVTDALRPLRECAEVMDYLHSLSIPIEAAEAAGCMTAVRHFADKPHNCLCYVNRVNGNVVNVKYRAVDMKLFCQDGQKDDDIPSAPFNIDCINPFIVGGEDGDGEGVSPTLIVTEGEKDCLTLLSCGFRHVISVPNGSACKPAVFMAPFVDWLHPFRRIIICGDNDRAGRRLKALLLEYFKPDTIIQDRHFRFTVATVELSTGCKDISEVLATYGADEVRRVVNSAIFPINPDIIRAEAMRGAIKDYLNGCYDQGYSLGYGPHTDEHLWLTDEGGLMIVTGRPGSGKTDWLRCTLVNLMTTGRPCCFLSFEEPNKEKHMGRIIQVLTGSRNTTCFRDDYIDRIIDWLHPMMADIDMRSAPPTTRNIIRYADDLITGGFPMRFLTIDPYLFIDMGSSRENETKLIKDMLTELQAWGRKRKVWVCMVAHPRMLNTVAGGEFEEIDPYKVSGSAHWANLSDFLISVRRIFPDGDTSDAGSRNPSYTKVSVLKVRDQDFCHTGNIYYMRHTSGRYIEMESEESCQQEIELHGEMCSQLTPIIEI